MTKSFLSKVQKSARKASGNNTREHRMKTIKVTRTGCENPPKSK